MRRVIVVLTIVLATSLAEGLTVLHDAGNTLPIAPYMPAQQSRDIGKGRGSATPHMTILPIRTPSMSPGKLIPRQHHLSHFQVPLFIIGNDPLSKQWIIERREQLISLNAVGILVAADSEEDVREIKALTEGLWIFPASGEDIAEELNLSHYPALISKIGIEQ